MLPSEFHLLQLCKPELSYNRKSKSLAHVGLSITEGKHM